MLNRRSLFAAMGAMGSLVGAAFTSRRAQAGTYTSTNLSPRGDMAPRGSNGRFERIPDLDLESKYDFVTGFRKFQNRFSPLVRDRVEKIMAERGGAKATAKKSSAVPGVPVLNTVKPRRKPAAGAIIFREDRPMKPPLRERAPSTASWALSYPRFR